MDYSYTYKSVAKYRQGEYCLNEIGDTAKRLGKKAFILCGNKAWEAAGERIANSLTEAGIAFETVKQSGFCSPDRINEYCEQLRSSGADFIIGVGGGKVMDSTKGMAYVTGSDFILVPTTASQCACCANVIILYDNNGDPLPYVWQSKHSAEAVFADTDILVRHCPARMMATGIADAIAKVPEIEFAHMRTDDWKGVLLAEHSFNIACEVFDLYKRSAVKAIRDTENKVISKEVNDIISANILMTGLSSNMSVGTWQFAFAHNLYYAMCLHFKEQQKKYMHGEMVSTGLLLQFALNGASEDRFNQCRDLLSDIGAPKTPVELGIPTNEENIRRLLDYCVGATPFLTAEDVKNAEKLMWELWTPAS